MTLRGKRRHRTLDKWPGNTDQATTPAGQRRLGLTAGKEGGKKNILVTTRVRRGLWGDLQRPWGGGRGPKVPQAEITGQNRAKAKGEGRDLLPVREQGAANNAGSEPSGEGTAETREPVTTAGEKEERKKFRESEEKQRNWKTYISERGMCPCGGNQGRLGTSVTHAGDLEAAKAPRTQTGSRGI